MTPIAGFRSTRRGAALAAFLLLPLATPSALAAAAKGDDLSILAANPDSALAVMVERQAGEPLTLEDALRAALSADPSLRAAAAGRDAARGAARSQGGEFWPELFGDLSRASDEQPTASVFSGADVLQNDQDALSAGARMTLPTGTELSATLSSTRLETNSSFATLSPQIDTYGELSITQPLLKGFGPAARSGRDAAEAQREQAEALYDDARLATAATVETSYWGLYAAERDHAVQLLIRDQAQAFLDEAELRAQAGLVGPGAVASARVFLAQQAQTVFDSEELLDQISDRLATLMGRRPDGAARYHALGAPPAEFPAADEDSLVVLAEAQSPSLAAAGRALDAARARARGAAWNALPSLDLYGAVGGRGLAGSGRTIITNFGGQPDTLVNTLDTGFGDAFGQVTSRDFPSWRLGLRFNVPLGATDRGERDRLKAEEARAAAQFSAARRALDETVRAQYRELARGRERLALAEDGVDASLEQVRIGLLEFKHGRSTTFELVRLGADLADAQRRYSAALVRTARAAATLRRLTAGAYPDPGPAGALSEETAP